MSEQDVQPEAIEVLVHRLREVVAQLGFSRFDSPALPVDADLDIGVRLAALAQEIRWLPAIENRGEGVFLGIDGEKVQKWTTRAGVKERARASAMREAS